MAASKQMLAAVASATAVVFFLPALASTTDHVVGDGHGWTLGFDYASWAESKQFTVGDTLELHALQHAMHLKYVLYAAFKYSSSFHDVAEVSGPDFKACNKAAATAVWSSGEDQVALDEPGRRWFICAVGEHCRLGMKLNVTVLPAPAATPAPLLPPAPAPAPSRALSRRFLSKWW